MTKYSISNFDGFVLHLRDSVAKTFAENYTENLDDFITIGQIKNLIKNQCHNTTEDGKYIISDHDFENIYDTIRVMMYESILSKLASNGYLECCWNSETNEMEFWKNDNAEQ